MKITDIIFFLTIIILKNEKQLKIQKYFKIKLSRNICQNDVINDNIIIKFSNLKCFVSSVCYE